MQKNICKWFDWQRISLQNLQITHEAKYQKANNPKPNKHTKKNKQNKWAEDLNRRHTDVQEAYEKMLNFAN